jgi:hypothetical protein
MLYRAWINQPSTHQKYHDRHGVNVLAEVIGTNGMVCVYFTDGPVISQMIHRSALSKGWR